ncbi:hypothetical protein [Micromonospora chalcea]|uniref:hypothetical protein n=1 Tax=Micromonospora chalcea TaxID=1874 RepID=UPI00332E08D2
MTERIRGKVAQLIDERTLVINRGAEHGVQVGMRFAVLNRKGADVVDPDTNEPIGSVDVEKVLVKVVRVEARLAVARTFRSFTTGIGAMFQSGVRHETLRTDSATYKQELDEEDSYVKIGDPVVEAVGEEFGDKS